MSTTPSSRPSPNPSAAVSAACAPGTVTWFEIGTDNPAAVSAFYGQLFGWSFLADRVSGLDYTMIVTGGEQPVGGIFATGGKVSNYAVFCVQVSDPAAVCAAAETLGGAVLVAPVQTDDGLAFAHLRDPNGNHFAIFAPPLRGSGQEAQE